MPTILSKLNNMLIGRGNTAPVSNVTNYNIPLGNVPILKFDNKEERDEALSVLKQQRLLSHQWLKAGHDSAMENTIGSTQVQLMYYDCDRMDLSMPEIGSALDIYSEEATTLDRTGQILKIRSNSDRVVSVLRDLFDNRLQISIMAEMIIRSLCKYGNNFMLLDIDVNNGVMGWRQLPVHEMRRYEGYTENGTVGDYAGSYVKLKPGEVGFVWEGHNEGIMYRNWQIAHFRLIKDSMYLPYGSSILNKARRAWRMLMMMEDAMLLYRLDRSVERRVFKVNVGAIDDNDVPSFLQEFMNNIKRAPIIDPQTGMLDLRKNFLDVSTDYVIPVRNQQDPSEITSLQPAQNPTSMDDINYMENKILSALRLPKPLLNYQDTTKGQNLSLLDIRTGRAVTSIQKAFLLELNKVAIIHLYLLGFTDDLNNFTLSMNNPSNQLEQFELDNQNKRLNNAIMAMQETGNGIPVMTWHQVQREIMGRTDKEIADMLVEYRIEKAIANELLLTAQIIKKTHVFDQADNLYGDPNAEYDYSQLEGGPGGGPGGGGGGFGGGGMGPSLDSLGGDDMEPIEGNEGTIDMSDVTNEPLMEAKKMLADSEQRINTYLNEYRTLIQGKKEPIMENGKLTDKAFIMNTEIDKMLESINTENITQLIEE